MKSFISSPETNLTKLIAKPIRLTSSLPEDILIILFKDPVQPFFLFGSKVIPPELSKPIHGWVEAIGSRAEMAELADARDLKSLVPKARPGSIPGLGTKCNDRQDGSGA